MIKGPKISVREDDKKNVWTHTKELTIDEALDILNPSNRFFSASEKRNAWNKIVKEIKKEKC